MFKLVCDFVCAAYVEMCSIHFFFFWNSEVRELREYYPLYQF